LGGSRRQLDTELASITQEGSPQAITLSEKAGQQIAYMFAVMHWIGEQLIRRAIFRAISVKF
jgi:hypothetical protein